MARIETEPTFSILAPERLFSLSDYLSANGRQYDIAPDGDWFIFRKREPSALSSDGDSFRGLIYVGNWNQELLERVPTN